MSLVVFVLASLAILLIALGPAAWVNEVIRRYDLERSDFPGNAGELACHLLRQANLREVKLSVSESDNRYQVRTRTILLKPEIIQGRSLSAVAIAAHEVGHAIQHHIGYRPIVCRDHLLGILQYTEKAAATILVVTPFVAVLTQLPLLGAGMFISGVALFGVSVLTQALALPVEFDASFNRALPILMCGYLDLTDLGASKRILRAYSLAGVASALANTVNFWYWISVFRR